MKPMHQRLADFVTENQCNPDFLLDEWLRRHNWSASTGQTIETDVTDCAPNDDTLRFRVTVERIS